MALKRVRVVVVFVFALVVVAPARATTFYVSNHGNDRSAGTSQNHPWQTIGRVDRAGLKPGDVVLFRGGDSFTDTTLTPHTSGTSKSPIVFGSYGGGDAKLSHSGIAVWFTRLRYVTFQDLDLSTGNSDGAVVAGSPSGGSSFITVRRCAIHDTAGVGVLSPTSADSSWKIVSNRITHTGDSGLIIEGSGVKILNNAITDTGWNNGISWDRHGIYMKGTNATIAGNTIIGFQANGISLRSRNANVVGNAISGGPFGIAFFDFEPGTGTTYVTDNKVHDVGVAFYFSRDPASFGGNPMENFVVTGNTFTANGSAAVDITGARFSQMRLASNVISGRFSAALAVYSPAGGGRYVEQKNTIIGNATFAWNGSWMSYSNYRQESGQGGGDTFRAPPS